jgi:hypothetical protein
VPKETMPANEDDTVSTNSTISHSDYNRFHISDTLKTTIFSQIQDSEESLTHWGDESENDAGGETSRRRQTGMTTALTAPGVKPGPSSLSRGLIGNGRQEEVEDTSDMLTPKATRKDMNPMEKVSTAERVDDNEKSRPGMLRRLTTRLRNTVNATQKS